MLTAYSFNSYYRPEHEAQLSYPSLRLLEGGKFEPAQYAPVLIKEEGQVRLHFYWWGMPESALKKISYQYYVPANHLNDRPRFAKAVYHNRCLVPADSFYVCANKAEKYKIALGKASTFCFAGIYEHRILDDGSIKSNFALLSVPASASFSKLNLQMPLILSPNDERIWLNPQAPVQAINNILQTHFRPNLQFHRVMELNEAAA